MADYYTQTVVNPPIPSSYMTVFENWLLSNIFQYDLDPDKQEQYFYHREGICPVLTVDQLSSVSFVSEIEQLKDHVNEEGELLVDDLLLIKIFQQIMGREPAFDAVEIISSYTCSKMRPDGFGGKKLIIMPDSHCVVDTSAGVVIETDNDERRSSDILVEQEAVSLLYQLYLAVLSNTGFVAAVRIESGRAYPWPAIDEIKDKIEDFLTKQGRLTAHSDHHPKVNTGDDYNSLSELKVGDFVKTTLGDGIVEEGGVIKIADSSDAKSTKH